jgi:hypothetical protein
VFDGLFGPWHILIILVVVLVFVGPKKLASRFRDTSDTLQHWADPDHPSPGERAESSGPAPRRSWLYRIGRLFRRRRVKD